ncbi:MAG: Sir2 silent information regulator family NAD-dependent deacetylase [Clostridia bacterium]|nr:Sir2 silent information regulator family NAD-dependent deacetylase [Clostridia bacterium]
MFSEPTIIKYTENYSNSIKKLKQALKTADTVVIGAGAGLSTSAGYIYNGERFLRYFSDFNEKYGFSDMYSGGFYPYATKEEFWGFWCRNIYINRYTKTPKPVYSELLELIKDKEYFVITTNVDHCFQKAGFDKKRIFYTQGDYGLFQCSTPCHNATYDNEEIIRAMILSEDFEIAENGELIFPKDKKVKMTVPSDHLPTCPVCGKPMTLNLRSDNRFVEDEGWHKAAERYENFLRTRGGKTLFLELGVGYNTPVIIKYPFWNMTAKNKDATYAAVNLGESVTIDTIADRSICINADIGDTIKDLAD